MAGVAARFFAFLTLTPVAGVTASFFAFFFALSAASSGAARARAGMLPVGITVVVPSHANTTLRPLGLFPRTVASNHSPLKSMFTVSPAANSAMLEVTPRGHQGLFLIICCQNSGFPPT